MSLLAKIERERPWVQKRPVRCHTCLDEGMVYEIKNLHSFGGQMRRHVAVCACLCDAGHRKMPEGPFVGTREVFNSLQLSVVDRVMLTGHDANKATRALLERLGLAYEPLRSLGMRLRSGEKSGLETPAAPQAAHPDPEPPPSEPAHEREFDDEVPF